MTTQTATMTSSEAIALAIEYTAKAADRAPNAEGPVIQNLTAIAQAYAAIANAAATQELTKAATA